MSNWAEKYMKKQGWKETGGIGKTLQGRSEPVKECFFIFEEVIQGQTVVLIENGPEVSPISNIYKITKKGKI